MWCLDLGCCPSIQGSDDAYHIFSVACVLHYLQGLVMVCGVECTAEVDVQAVDVLLGEACIFHSMDDVMALSVGVLLFSKSLL